MREGGEVPKHRTGEYEWREQCGGSEPNRVNRELKVWRKVWDGMEGQGRRSGLTLNEESGAWRNGRRIEFPNLLMVCNCVD